MRKRYASIAQEKEYNTVIAKRVKLRLCIHCGGYVSAIGFCSRECALDIGFVFIPLPEEMLWLKTVRV